jgi:hypothetical protein
MDPRGRAGKGAEGRDLPGPFYGDLRIMPMLWREVLVGAGLRFQLSA